MSKNEWKKRIAITGRLLLAFALIFAQGAWAGQNQETKDKAESRATAATAKALSRQSQPGQRTRDGSHEGIKVHGHWTIEVRNPDGAVVTHREFENSLQGNQGAGLIVNVLARQWSQGLWSIDLIGNPFSPIGPGPCPTGTSSAPGPSDCLIAEPQVPGSVASGPYFGTLSVSALNNGPSFAPSGPAPVLVLSGTAVAQANGTVTAVQSSIYECLAVVAPANPCVPGSANQAGGYGFTAQTLSSPIPVSAGQTIAVTVNITFS